MEVMLRTKDFKVTKEKISFETPKMSEFELYKKMHELFEFIYKEQPFFNEFIQIVRITIRNK